MPGEGKFPPVVDRCVQSVMAKGHDEASAYAICRTSLGLADGNDGASLEMTDEAMADILKTVQPVVKEAAGPGAEMQTKIEPCVGDGVEVEKALYNENHDEFGQFSSGDGSTPSERSYNSMRSQRASMLRHRVELDRQIKDHKFAEAAHVARKDERSARFQRTMGAQKRQLYKDNESEIAQLESSIINHPEHLKRKGAARNEGEPEKALYNPNHDDAGRFSDGGGEGGKAAAREQYHREMAQAHLNAAGVSHRNGEFAKGQQHADAAYAHDTSKRMYEAARFSHALGGNSPRANAEFKAAEMHGQNSINISDRLLPKMPTKIPKYGTLDGVDDPEKSLADTHVAPEPTLVPISPSIAPTSPSNPAPIHFQDIVVARAGLNFVNGTQEFDLTTANIDEIVRNFKLLGKQVPLLLTPDHIFGGRRSAIPAAGWVEEMYRDGNDWRAKCKFIGDAAQYVLNDQFRGVSIGTVMAKDVHGVLVGEALDHLLITNSPFFPLNIAASESATGVGEVRYITPTPPLKGDDTMPPAPLPNPQDPTPEKVMKSLQQDVIAKDAQIRALEAKNHLLQDAIDTQQTTLLASATPAEKKAMQEEIVRLKTTSFVMQVRALVAHGLKEGKFLPVWAKGYEGKDALDSEGTLNWLRSSRFYDANQVDPDTQAFQFLKFASEQFPKQMNVNREYPSGTPLPGSSFQPTPEEKKVLARMNVDAARLSALDNVTNFNEWKAATGYKETK